MNRVVTIVAGGLILTGCGDPPRENRVEKISNVSCDRFRACGEIEERFGSYSQCITEMDDFYFNLWPDNQCGSGEINADRYDVCIDEARNYPCNSNIFDGGAFIARCNAGQVCIDPADR